MDFKLWLENEQPHRFISIFAATKMSDEELLMAKMPAAESTLISWFLYLRQITAPAPAYNNKRLIIVYSKKPRQTLAKLKQNGICDYRETLSKSGTRLLKREWFIIQKSAI